MNTVVYNTVLGGKGSPEGLYKVLSHLKMNIGESEDGGKNTMMSSNTVLK